MQINAISPVRFQNYKSISKSNISFSGIKKNAKADDNKFQEKDLLFVKNKVAEVLDTATEVLNKSKKEYTKGMGIINEAVKATPSYMKGEGELKIANKPFDIMDAKSKSMIITSPKDNITVKYMKNGDIKISKDNYIVSLLNNYTYSNQPNTLIVEKTDLSGKNVMFDKEQYIFDDFLNINSFKYSKISRQYAAKGGETDETELYTDSKGYLRNYKDKDINIHFYNKNSNALAAYKGKKVDINLLTDEIEVK